MLSARAAGRVLARDASALRDLSSRGTENPHRHRIVSGNAHIADKHESMWLRNPPQNSEFCDRVLPQKKASDRRQASRCRETQEFCKTAMSLGFLTEEQASRVVQAQSQGRQFLPPCGFSVPLLILLANSLVGGLEPRGRSQDGLLWPNPLPPSAE